MSDAHPVLPGTEPYSAAGNPTANSGGRPGALVLHGFTGSPHSMRGLAEAYAAAGFSVELPRLPGHGTSVADMLPTRWPDWLAAADTAYSDLASRCDRVVVSGLSMGGTLTLALAEKHPEIAGIVLINAAVDSEEAAGMRGALQPLLDTGTETMPGIGDDIAEPGVTEGAYAEVPIAALLSLLDGFQQVRPGVGSIACPALVFHSTDDHVVGPRAAEILTAELGGGVELVTLERSYHVATLDYDKDEINRRAVDFGRRVTSAKPRGSDGK